MNDLTELLLISQDELHLLRLEEETIEEYDELRQYAKNFLKDESLDLPQSEIKDNINLLFN